ncbi:hypothetical protein SKAU_G00305230 [Synaphobranchus kaupii]|uniref:L-fucose kinase n=1 Tax=Synaphobranchus kaupii TaxID=118154 RepID=A0A9Q1IIK8_SYNKA|nr:hypothetical protein SKAU_G00305230 [Synaphobranchus kaupii]
MARPAALDWTVIILTCQHKDSVYAFQRELEVRQQRGSLPKGALLLTVADPQERLGSGGATLNALLVAAEHLSARAGHTVVTADVLENAYILILHTGRDFPWDSCGRAFCWLAVQEAAWPVERPVCCLDLQLSILTHQVCCGSPPGVWVCSTDMILQFPSSPAMSWDGFYGVRVLSLPGEVTYATSHGVYLTDEQVKCTGFGGRKSSDQQYFGRGSRRFPWSSRSALPPEGPRACAIRLFTVGLELSTLSRAPQLALPNDIIIQGHRVQLGELQLTVFTVLGTHDDLEASLDDPSATILNQQWTDFYKRTGIQPGDLGGSGGDGDARPRLHDVRLFPVFQPRGGAVGLEGVEWLLGGAGGGAWEAERWRAAWRLSLREVLSCTDQQGALRWREELFYRAARRRAGDALRGRTDRSLLPSIRAAVLGGQQEALLRTLDSVAAVSSEDLGAGRPLTPRGAPALALLERGDLPGGVQALAEERQNWKSRPDLLLRAARHYEGAGQVLLRQAVMSAQRFVSIGQGKVPPIGEWQEVECPARLDLSGGWSDTPPIAFERGGAVVNVAIQVGSRRPIGARARRIKEPRLLLVSSGGGRDCQVATETVCLTLQDLEDHCQPHAPGALLKAVCLCSGLVTFPSQQPLGQQLLQRWGGGVELRSWSLLPHGSGMGTSSILAGALLAAVYRCTGRTFDTDSLIHAVLHLEQILTTGGGWQDQVGGLVGGVKIARSRPCLPLKVEVEKLDLSKDFLLSLQQRLLLVYTGKTRLARNLLQDVVRSWYGRLPSIVENTEELVSNAEECARACVEGSLPRLGVCLDRYWQQKKAMAPGCEPAAVRSMMAALRPLTLGQSLAGAGGGGFLFLLTREPLQEDRVRQVLSNTQGLGDLSVHSVEIDMEGISLRPRAESPA